MTNSFATQYDRIPDLQRDDPRIIASERAEYMAAHGHPSEGGSAAASLADPTLLRTAAIERLAVDRERVLIDFGVVFPKDAAAEELFTAPQGTPLRERFSGPVRLIAEGDASVQCTGSDPASPDPQDSIVWNELRSARGSTDQSELILVCVSGRHWSVRAKCFRFATLNLPG